MKRRLLPLGFLGLVLLLNGAVSSLMAQGDEPTVKILDSSSGIRTDFVDLPGAVSGSPALSVPIDSKKWLKIDINYSTEAPNEIIPELKFKVYVEVPDVKGPRDSRTDKFVILTGEATYVNVPAGSAGRELHATFYVHPFTVNRYGGERNFHFGQNQNIHVDAFIGEQKAASKDAYEVGAADKNWYQSESEKKVSGFVMSREQSPFILVDAASYPPVKVKAPAAAAE